MSVSGCSTLSVRGDYGPSRWYNTVLRVKSGFSLYLLPSYFNKFFGGGSSVEFIDYPLKVFLMQFFDPCLAQDTASGRQFVIDPRHTQDDSRELHPRRPTPLRAERARGRPYANTRPPEAGTSPHPRGHFFSLCHLRLPFSFLFPRFSRLGHTFFTTFVAQKRCRFSWLGLWLIGGDCLSTWRLGTGQLIFFRCWYDSERPLIDLLRIGAVPKSAG